ncbi:ascorbate-dependent monooxygenase [Paludibaculum fermentans]|uniref:ascorbate-dependent monooxygenase n=1 Tax=Paludibaculum fermentans TaxID=1473598 RepID=UPI003EBE7B22
MRRFAPFLLISALSPSAFSAPPTFNRDIAPILYRHCTACHRPGEVAPFPLLTHRDAAKRARLIASVTQARIMPPWKAEPGHGDFAGERRLTPVEIERIQKWARAGAPEGDPQHRLPLPAFPDGWQLGQPDEVLTMASAVQLPPDGPDQFRCLVLPRNAVSDIFVRGVEFRPGNRRLVHHALVFLDSSGTARKLAAGSQDGSYACFGGPGFRPAGMLAGWAPGATPVLDPPDWAQAIPEGTDVVLQVHYHPTGKRELDQSSLGLTYSTPPTKGRAAITLFNRRIDILPGDPHYVVRASVVVPRDVELFGIAPHAHYLATQMKVDAHLPDGTITPLIWIRDWDFNWQGQYRYKQPLHLPKGTRLALEYVYDNSKNNPHNSADPPVRVTWGEETRNEMAVAFLGVVLPSIADVPSFRREMRLQYLDSLLPTGFSPDDLPTGVQPAAVKGPGGKSTPRTRTVSK